MCYPEYLADFMQIEIGSLELESRSARCHFQIRNLCERVEYFFSNAITEVGGVLVVTQILERKHCDAFQGNPCGRIGASRTGTIGSRIATKKKQSDRDGAANHNNINPTVFLWLCSCRHRVSRFRSFNSLRCQLEHPRQHQRHGQSNNDEQHNCANDRAGNLENWKNLRDSLRKCPAADDVGNRYLVDIAPLQFGKEVAALHFEDARNSRVGTIFSASASKRGSPRSGVRSGSTRIGPMLKPSRS